MMGGGFNGFYTGPIAATDAEKPVDPMTQPLPVAAPETWVGREDRARWVLLHFTKGEKATLKRMIDDELRHYDLRSLERKEREALMPKKKEDARWP